MAPRPASFMRAATARVQDERSCQVDAQHLVPFQEVHVESARAWKNSGVVDEAVGLAPFPLEGGNPGPRPHRRR